VSSKYFYITSYDSTMNVFFDKKGFNINFVYSNIELDDELLIKHQLLPIPKSVINSNIKKESFTNEASFEARIKELYVELRPERNLEDFIKKNKVTIPVTMARYEFLNPSAKKEVSISGACPTCGEETLHCTYYTVGMNDPGEVFSHACFSCLTVLNEKSTYGTPFEEKCPFCNKDWSPEKK
jgi:hypothetical protein